MYKRQLLYHLIKEKLQIKEDAIHQDGLFNYDVSNSEIEQWAYEMGNMEDVYKRQLLILFVTYIHSICL